jgi:ABC-type branched-subunit amino acid transport system substrate-binding protein
MKLIKPVLLSVLVSVTVIASPVTGQSFQEALQLYEQEQFEEAIDMLKELEESDQQALYIGKSYLALGKYLPAGHYLKQANQSSQSGIANEAFFTLAINEFRLRNFGNALAILNELKARRDQAGIRSQAQRFYNEILRYLTPDQRFEIFWQLDEPGIRFDLVRSAIGRSDYSMVRSMLNELETLSEFLQDTTELATIRDAIGTSDTYYQSPAQRYQAPEGMVYHVGVALPSFEPDEPEFVVSRDLYFGMILAADDFNSRNPDKKVFLRFRDTHASPDSVPLAMNELVWNERVDAVIGPLYSDEAEVMSQMAENYEIPILTPLANSDEINLGHNYTFQLNPTFSVHGRQMAEFAVQELNLDTLAVITEANSFGQRSALAFRHEAERLGAHVAYYFQEDFGALGYDLTDVTEIFTQDEILVDSLNIVPVKGVYAPFTGQAANTLINLLMTDLEAMRSDVVVMGSEEWRDARYTNAQRNNFAIYYTQNHSSLTDAETLEYFQEDFVNRFGIEPGQFATVGFDAGSYLFSTLEEAGNPKRLKQALREAPEYSGLSIRIHFDNSQINNRVTVEPLTGQARELLGLEPEPENPDGNNEGTNRNLIEN